VDEAVAGRPEALLARQGAKEPGERDGERTGLPNGSRDWVDTLPEVK
jgi:hypothetical protein